VLAICVERLGRCLAKAEKSLRDKSSQPVIV
jgi:hypothetical protein